MPYYTVTVSTEVRVKANSCKQALERSRDSENWACQPVGPGWGTSAAMPPVAKAKEEEG